MTKAAELRQKDEAGLKEEVKSLQKAHFALRMQKATQQLGNTATIKATRRDGRPGGDRAGAGRGPRRPVGANVAPADGSDKPAGAGADATAVKRVRKTDAPATAADGKGE